MEDNKKINGYLSLNVVSEGTECTEGLRDVKFIYYSDGTEVTRSILYKAVPLKRVKKAEKKLDDYTMHNDKQTSIANVIPFVTIVHEVERIIFDEK